jgi:dGTPase
LRSLLPEEYLPKQETELGNLTEEEKYKRVLSILDYISGMTDKYAVSLYGKIKGYK